MDRENVGKWSVSANEELWGGYETWPTKEEAIANASISEALEHLSDGDRFYVGQIVDPTFNISGIDADSFLENVELESALN